MASNNRTGCQLFNKHTLNLRTTGLSREEVSGAIQTLLASIKKDHNLTTPVYLNYVNRFDRDTRSVVHSGVCYLYIKDPRVFYMILGQNPDGTDRVETKPDPDWVPPKEEEEEIKVSFDFNSGMGWGDMMVELEKAESKKEAPLIRIQLPSLVGPLIAQTKEGPVHIKVEQSFVTLTDEVSDTCDTSALYAIIDNNISDQSIRQFLSFFSDSNGYPKVSFRSNPKNPKTRSMIARFDPNSNDAMFCLQLIKVVELMGGDKKYYTTFFGHLKRYSR